MNLNKCLYCGKHPDLFGRSYGGQGDGRIDYYVECSCGARGRCFSNFDFIIRKNGYDDVNAMADEKAKRHAVSSWNKVSTAIECICLKRPN